jgi:5S rRNA maturation endonuclease (ribonuclease M5)
MLTPIQDAINLLLPTKRKAHSATKWVSFNAVCCHHNGERADTRGRGGIIVNPDGAITYSCFNCRFSASYQPGRHLTYKFRKLLSWFGADENTIKRLVIEAIRVKELIAPEANQPCPEREAITFKARPLPKEASSFHSLNTFYTLNGNQNVPKEWHDSVLYVASRNTDLAKYDFYWTPETAHNLNKRVIIPFTWQNQTIGYTARSVYDGIKPKYFNSHEPNYVFNVDKQLPTSKFVIVCEGPFDAMAIDGVAILGNEVNEQQAEIIDQLGRQVIVVPDFDKAGARMIHHAIEYGWDVSYPIWSEQHKDINSAVIEYGKLFVLKSILDAVETSRLKIEIRKRKLYA